MKIFSCLMHQRLQKLLVQYPPLVVHVNSFQARNISHTKDNSRAGSHDCSRESKDYFKHKLLQFGIGTKVPIKTLLCYYKKAPDQTRNIFRPRINEFTKFLSKHHDTFQVDGDSVLLVGIDDLKDVPNKIALETLCENNCPKSGTHLSSPIISTIPTSVQQSSPNRRVILNAKDSKFVTNAIMNSAGNSGEQIVIALDCEGMNLGEKGKLSLIQLGTKLGETFIFDVLHCPQVMAYGGLQSLLESDRVIKVIHDCRGDSANLFAQFQIVLRNVFDTQAAHTVLQCQEQGMQVYEVQDISLNELCGLYNVPLNSMKDKVKKMYQTYPNCWERRPLSSDMLLYAEEDVLSLINEKLYAAIASAIKPEFKPLLSELCAERILKTILPTEVKLRVDQRKAETVKRKLCREYVELSNWEVELLESLDLTEDEKKLLAAHKVEKELDKVDRLNIADRDK